MNNDDRIGKMLEALLQGQERQEKIQHEQGKKLDGLEKRLGTFENRTDTALDAVKAGIEDVQAYQKQQPTKQDIETTVDSAKAELKADMLMLESKVVKKIQSHERRITNIEDQENIKNPDKN